MNRPKATTTNTPALPKPLACSIRAPTLSEATASTYAIKPKPATPARAKRTLTRSLDTGNARSTRLCEKSDDATSSVLSTVERMAEISAPANSV